jgi:hypothetical protein
MNNSQIGETSKKMRRMSASEKCNDLAFHLTRNMNNFLDKNSKMCTIFK